MENADKPVVLSIGTEVSVKYKGSFCEAKIQKISKNVECKVQFSNGTVSIISDEAVKGPLNVGATIEIKSDKKELERATIQNIEDHSQYTIVFVDGDTSCLKRSALCLKNGRHFSTSFTLDQLPPTHPEPIESFIVCGHRSQRNKSFGENKELEVIEMGDFNVGSVLCVETNDKKKVRDNWFPGLIVAPTAQSSVKTNIAEEYLVRSFADGKYCTVQKKESLKLYNSEIGAKVENHTLKTAVEKAQLYITKDELPPHWDRSLLFGTDKCMYTDSECAYDSNYSDKELIEEKDHFVATLFKFMDDRGTPLNQVPNMNGKDLDLYQLYKLVTFLGGFNKVTKSEQWNIVSLKMGEDDQNISFKQIYQQHLLCFEDFNRKLGCTMLSHPRGLKSHRRVSRNILIRDINKALPDKNKQTSVNQESNEKKDKSETMKRADIFKDPGIIEKNAEGAKSNGKSNKTVESSEKSKEKTDDVSNNTSHGKLVKWDSDILDTKYSKAKNQLTEIIKKESESKQDDIETAADKKEPKEKIFRNLFGKNVKNPPKKEKVVKAIHAKTGLQTMRKTRSIKEQLKSFIKVITPFTNSKRRASSVDCPKLTRSKCKEEVPNKSRRMSVQSNRKVSSTLILSESSGLVEENLSTSKKMENTFEERKPTWEKKDEKEDKLMSYDLMTTPISSEVESPLKDPPSEIAVGDHVVVSYGNNDPIAYDAKILKVAVVEGVLLYLVHYKGWNNRYNEWVEHTRITLKFRGSAREPEHDEANMLKNEPKGLDPIKTTPTNRKRRSTTPSLSNSNKKKLSFSSIRPTRTCTLNDLPLSSIYKSNSESEDNGNIDLEKKNKSSQQIEYSIKSEQDIVIKTESSDTNNQKNMYPKTYPSKQLLMQRKQSITPVVVVKNEPMKQSVSEINNENLFDNNITLDIKENLCIQNEIKDPVLHNTSDNESNISENLITNDVIIDTSHINEVREDSQNKICHTELETDIKDEVLDLSLKPCESPPSNVLNVPEPNEINYIIAEDDNDDDDDDESKLVIAENDNIDHEYQMNTNQIIIGEENNSSNYKSENLNKVLIGEENISSNDKSENVKQILIDEENNSSNDKSENVNQILIGEENISSNDKSENVNQILIGEENISSNDKSDNVNQILISEEINSSNEKSENAKQILIDEENISSNGRSENVITESPLPLSPSVHQLPCIDSEFQSSYEEQRNISTPKDFDDESTTSCNESVLNALIQSFKKYNSQLLENPSTNTKSYESFIDNNDDSTKSGFESGSNSKSPTIDNTENMESTIELPTYESSNNKKHDVEADYGIEKIRDNPEKVILRELQCREKIVDEKTLNNASVIECNKNNLEFNIHKPSTSKGFFDSINQPRFSKDNFYDTDPGCDTKNSFLEHRQVNLAKSVIFDTYSPSTSKSGLFDDNYLGCNIKDNFYDSIPSSSKSSDFYETSEPSTSKSFNNPETDVNNVLFCEETIPRSPTDILEDHYDQDELKRAISPIDEVREAASAIYTMNKTFKRPMVTLMGASEKELEENTNILNNNEGLLDHGHLQFLAEISSINLSVNIRDSSGKISFEEIAKLSEIRHLKHNNSNHEHSPSKLNETSFTAPTEDTVEKSAVIPIPFKNGKPMIEFAPDMNSTQRQALIVAKMNDLRKEYIEVKSRLSVIDRRRKKIRKRKREMAKAALSSYNKQTLAGTAK